jgi:hypothetical protein
MKRAWKLTLKLCLWSMLGVAAAPAANAEPAAAPRGGLEERIDLAVKAAAPAELFGTFAKMLGPDVVAVVDPAVRTPVSIELHNVRARILLDAVCESIGCRWSLEPGRPPNPPKLRVVPAPPGGRAEESRKPSDLKEPIDLKVTNADGHDVLRTFGDLLDANVVVEPGVAGEVSLSLEDIPLGQCLDAVCQSLGCDWSFTEGGNGAKPVLRVTARPKKK